MSWTRFFRRRYWDEERARELDAHLAHEIDDNLARGMTLVEARRAAHHKLGNPTRIREEIYALNSLGFLESLWQDLRYGARLLRRNPTFAGVAILTLALGTGANTAMFEVMNAVWLRGLPVRDPDALVQVELDPTKGDRAGDRTGRYSVLSVPEWEQLRQRQTVFSSVAAWGTSDFDIARGGPMQVIEGLWVSGSFFDTIGVPAFRGRTIVPVDDIPGCGSAGIVVSYRFWQRHFAGDPAVIGKTLPLNGHPLEIIGVTPPAFTGIEVGRSFDVAAPLCAEPTLDGAADPRPRPTFWFIDAIGRLAPGVTIAQASAQLEALSPSLYRATLPSTYDAADREGYLALTLTAVSAATGVSTLRGQYQAPVWVLLAATGLVLLIACANLANLMLARATARTREISVRLAIGASRARVVRQLLSESLLIAVAGAGAGLLVARWSVAGLVALMNRSDPALWLEVAPDWRVFAFTSAVALAACLIFGLAPALRGTAVDPGAVMKAGGRGLTEPAGRFSLRGALVVVQVALSLVLLTAALLFGRTLRNLSHEDLGFQPDGILVAALDLSSVHVPAQPEAMFHDRLLNRIRALPGVDAAAEVSVLPIDGSGWNGHIVVDGRKAETLPMFNSVTPGFFATMHGAVVSGRDFRRMDATGPRVAIVNQTFARAYLGPGNPVGRAFDVVTPVGTPRPRYTVIGVVADAKYRNLREPFLPTAYSDMEQTPADDAQPHLVVRSSLPIAALSDALTRAVADLSPRVSVRYRTLQSVIDQALSRERVTAILCGVFGGLAVLIAAVGLYGVMSYTVAQRRVEIGVRMALGADRTTVMRLIVREAAVLLTAGLVLGLSLAIPAGRAASALLFGVQPSDPSTVAIAMGSLTLVSLVATWLPARRASSLEPTIALRTE